MKNKQKKLDFRGICYYIIYMNHYYEYRVYPTAEQAELIRKTFGCVRKYYNQALQDNNEYYAKNKKGLIKTPAKYKEQFPYLKEVDSMALCNAQMNLRTAFTNFFQHRSKKPKWKSKKNNRQSYTTNNIKNSIRFENGKIRLPKLGLVNGIFHRWCYGNIKSVTVKMQPNGKFFVSILTEQEPKIKEMDVKNKILGIDMSMGGFGVTNEGIKFNPPKWFEQTKERLKKAQQKFARQKDKSSKRREKQRIKIANIYQHMVNQRKDWLNKLSRQISDTYDVVVLETINLRAMSNMFGKSISQNGFGIFKQMLEYKMKERLGMVFYADRFFASTQLCSSCGFKNQEVKGPSNLGIRSWTCPVCGTVHDRDVNAAKNLVNHYNQITSASATEAHAHRDNVRPRKRIVKVRLRAVANEVRKIKGHGPELCSDSSGSNPSSTRL